MTRKTSVILTLASAIALGGTSVMAMDNERELVGHKMAMDEGMMSLFEAIDTNKDGSVSAEEFETHQAMMNKMVMMIVKRDGK